MLRKTYLLLLVIILVFAFLAMLGISFASTDEKIIDCFSRGCYGIQVSDSQSNVHLNIWSQSQLPNFHPKWHGKKAEVPYKITLTVMDRETVDNLVKQWGSKVRYKYASISYGQIKISREGDVDLEPMHPAEIHYLGPGPGRTSFKVTAVTSQDKRKPAIEPRKYSILIELVDVVGVTPDGSNVQLGNIKFRFMDEIRFYHIPTEREWSGLPFNIIHGGGTGGGGGVIREEDFPKPTYANGPIPEIGYTINVIICDPSKTAESLIGCPEIDEGIIIKR